MQKSDAEPAHRDRPSAGLVEPPFIWPERKSPGRAPTGHLWRVLRQLLAGVRRARVCRLGRVRWRFGRAAVRRGAWTGVKF